VIVFAFFTFIVNAIHSLWSGHPGKVGTKMSVIPRTLVSRGLSDIYRCISTVSPLYTSNSDIEYIIETNLVRYSYTEGFNIRFQILAVSCV